MKKIISLGLAAIMLLGVFVLAGCGQTAATDVPDSDTTTEQATEEETTTEQATEETTEEAYPVWWQDEKYANYTKSELHDESMRRGYHIPTLEEDFHDDLIIVFLKSEYSKTNGEFDEDEFRKISQNFASIINTSEEDIANLMADLFRQRIEITLKETGKEKVIEAIVALMEMDMVLIAMPDYIYGVTLLG